MNIVFTKILRNKNKKTKEKNIQTKFLTVFS